MSDVPPTAHDTPSEEELRHAIRRSVTEWARFILHPEGRQPAPHQLLLLDELNGLSGGETDRLMVMMPPGSAKSTYASLLFPVWWFIQHPGSSVIAASHTAGLGVHFGRQVRNLIADHRVRLGYDLAPGNRAAGQWRTTHRGEYLATGVRGAITGRRADLALIDDPIRSLAEADVAGRRDGLWNWYQSELVTRLKPRGRVVLVMTRWHEDDIAGRLQSHETSQWRVLRLPALAEGDDALGRQVSLPLWPEWESTTQLERKRGSVGERTWRSLFQQAPRREEGGLFRADRVDVLEEHPADSAGRVVRAWDLAATASDGSSDPDWTVGLKLLYEPQGRYVILDIMRLRGSPHEVVQTIVRTAEQDGHEVRIGLPQDPGQAGKTQVAFLVGLLGGYQVAHSPETGSKLTRAMPVASQIEARNFAVVRANWNAAFLQELRDFPEGRKDDQIDALSRAFGLVTKITPPARRLSTFHFAR